MSFRSIFGGKSKTCMFSNIWNYVYEFNIIETLLGFLRKNFNKRGKQTAIRKHSKSIYIKINYILNSSITSHISGYNGYMFNSIYFKNSKMYETINTILALLNCKDWKNVWKWIHNIGNNQNDYVDLFLLGNLTILFSNYHADAVVRILFQRCSLYCFTV